jgi:hypothetical protein
MCAPGPQPYLRCHAIEGAEMTSPNQITYLAVKARTETALRAAAVARRAAGPGPPAATTRPGRRASLRTLVRRLRPA